MASIRRRAPLDREPITNPQTLPQFLSKVFREQRLKKGFAMHLVAKASGLSQGFICDFENCVRGISCDSWAALAGAVGLDPAKGFERAYRKFQDAEQFGG